MNWPDYAAELLAERAEISVFLSEWARHARIAVDPEHEPAIETLKRLRKKYAALERAAAASRESRR